MTLPTEEQSSASDFKFALPDWPYAFWDLPPVAGAAFDRFTADRLITTKMLTVSPMSPSTDLTHFEVRIYEEIASYEEATGGPLRCDGFASRGKNGLGRLEAHLIFQKSPDMALLKRLMRKIGSVIVTGDYDSPEDWTHLSQDRKNHPPHNGCLHYVAQHADHPDNRRIWNKVLPMGRKTVAPAKQDSVQNQRDAEFQRELENKVWLGQNDRPRDRSPVANSGSRKPLSDASGADRIDENIADVDTIPTGSPDSGARSASID